MVSRVQHFSSILVEECTAGESTVFPADARAIFVNDGASTFMVDARDLQALKILVALVLGLLSNTGASPYQAPSPQPRTGTEGPWGWLSPASLATAMEDVVLVAADTVCHLVGKGENST